MSNFSLAKLSLDHINTFSSARCRHGDCRMSSWSVVLDLGAIWSVCLFEVFWNGWTSTWFPLGSVNICLRYAATIHVFFFLQTHFFLVFLFPFHHCHNQYNQQQWKYCWGYSEIKCDSGILWDVRRFSITVLVLWTFCGVIRKVQSLQHYPSECIPHCDNKKATPRVRGLIAVLAGLRAPDMVNGALICDFLLQSVENNPFLFWIQMHQKRANQLKTRKWPFTVSLNTKMLKWGPTKLMGIDSLLTQGKLKSPK